LSVFIFDVELFFAAWFLLSLCCNVSLIIPYLLWIYSTLF